MGERNGSNIRGHFGAYTLTLYLIQTRPLLRALHGIYLPTPKATLIPPIFLLVDLHPTIMDAVRNGSLVKCTRLRRWHPFVSQRRGTYKRE